MSHPWSIASLFNSKTEGSHLVPPQLGPCDPSTTGVGSSKLLSPPQTPPAVALHSHSWPALVSHSCMGGQAAEQAPCSHPHASTNTSRRVAMKTRQKRGQDSPFQPHHSIPEGNNKVRPTFTPKAPTCQVLKARPCFPHEM